ncbi:MAG: glycosyltransferase, partial [Lysobacterales bacterium]
QALAEWCAANGDMVGALVHQRPGIWRSARESIGGVEVWRAGCIAAPVYTPLSPAYPLEFSRVLREFKPDLLHLHFPNPSCFAALASPVARHLPWVVHWHADVPPDSPDWRLRAAYRLYRPFERAALARAGAIIATSQPYLDASVALQPWRAKTHVVALGISEVTAPLDTQSSFRRMLESSVSSVSRPAGFRRNDELLGRWRNAAGLHLLAVGRLSRYKGFDVLIEALAQIADATVLLVGDGECAHELKTLAAARGVAGRIAFAGNLDDATLAAAYAAADAFVLPSLDRSEAFGLVLLEAMRAGLGVIASAIPGSGVGTVVSDAETGLLVAAGNPVALAGAIGRLRDTDLRARLGRAGRARWLSEFTLQRSAQAIRSIYRSLC